MTLPKSRELLGIVAMRPSSKVTSPHLHRFYTLSNVYPFNVQAMSPPFCIDGAGGLAWPFAESNITGNHVGVCESKQLVRGILRFPGKQSLGADADLTLSVSINDCETSLVKIALAPVVALLQPISKHPARNDVPHIIHQVWISEDNGSPPPFMKRWLESWQKMNPHWVVWMWRSESARKFVISHYPWLLSIYDEFDLIVKRADLLRYLVLHHFGGLAIDIDLESLRPIHRLFGEFKTPVQIAEHDVQRGFYSIGFMASVPLHPLWWHLAHEVKRVAMYNPRTYVVDATGNGLLTRMARHPSFRSDIASIPARIIFPFPYTHKRTRTARRCHTDAAWCSSHFPDSYTVHHAAHSWAAEDAQREPEEWYEQVAAAVDGVSKSLPTRTQDL